MANPKICGQGRSRSAASSLLSSVYVCVAFGKHVVVFWTRSRAFPPCLAPSFPRLHPARRALSIANSSNIIQTLYRTLSDSDAAKHQQIRTPLESVTFFYYIRDTVVWSPGRGQQRKSTFPPTLRLQFARPLHLGRTMIGVLRFGYSKYHTFLQ